MGHQCLQKTALRCAGCADWSEFVLDQSQNRTKLLLLCSINLNDLNAIQWSTFQTPCCVFGEVFFDVFCCLFSFRTSEETLGSSFIGFFHFPLLKPKPFSAPLVCQCSHTSENPLSLNMIKFYIYGSFSPGRGKKAKFVLIFLLTFLWPNGLMFSSFLNCSEKIISLGV